jgi:hypothetical protein
LFRKKSTVDKMISAGNIFHPFVFGVVMHHPRDLANLIKAGASVNCQNRQFEVKRT